MTYKKQQKPPTNVKFFRAKISWKGALKFTFSNVFLLNTSPQIILPFYQILISFRAKEIFKGCVKFLFFYIFFYQIHMHRSICLSNKY